MNRLHTLHLAAALAASALSASAFSYSWFQYGGIDVVWPGGQSVRWLSPTTFPEGSETDTLILASMGAWNLVPAADFEFFYDRPPQDFPIDNFDGYSDTIAVPAGDLDPGVLGATYMVNDGAAWFDMDMVFADVPDGVGWTFDTAPDCDVLANPAPSNGYVFLIVAQHEMGHALGLGHDPIGDEAPGTPWFIGTMNPRYPSGGTLGDEHIIELHTDDRTGTRYLYPHGGPSEPPYVDLANAEYTTSDVLGKAAPVFFDPLIIAPAEEITIRSVIENFGTTNEFYVPMGFYLSVDDRITSADLLLGGVDWDLPMDDAYDFDAIIDMPADLAAGLYYVGTILDDGDTVTEEWEDNNIVLYCEQLEVIQLQPEINALGGDVTDDSGPYVGPAPTVTKPLNMAPITWSLDNPEPGMTMNPATGVITWPAPIASSFQYVLIVRATNDAGSDTELFLLGVEEAADPCPWDLAGSGDGFVGLGDLNALLSNWGPCPDPPAECPWDLNGTGDGFVGLGDLNALLSNWGPCP
jgi:hypothetical protein